MGDKTMKKMLVLLLVMGFSNSGFGALEGQMNCVVKSENDWWNIEGIVTVEKSSDSSYSMKFKDINNLINLSDVQVQEDEADDIFDQPAPVYFIVGSYSEYDPDLDAEGKVTYRLHVTEEVKDSGIYTGTLKISIAAFDDDAADEIIAQAVCSL